MISITDMRALIIALMALLLAGCAEQVGRYQIAPNVGGSVWRIDTRTGEMEICGFEFGSVPPKPTCTLFPAPPQAKKGEVR